MTSDAGLQVQRRGSGLWLTIDRPDERNALTLELALALTAAITDLDDDVRAVVITATGTFFSPGASASLLESLLAGGIDAVRSGIYGPLHGLVRAIATVPVPVIGALNGPAAGGGLDLALACDLRIAVPTTWLQSSWVTLGLIPGMGGAFAAQRLLGSARANELVMLGKRLSAEQALEWGLINAVTDKLDATVDEYVAHIASLPRGGVAASKQVLRRERDAGLEAELQLVGQQQSELITSPEFAATLEAIRRR